MQKDASHLSDEPDGSDSDAELVRRLRDDERRARPAEAIEENAPVDLERIGDDEFRPTQGN
ncbi:MAG TPA: hypothetical protein VKI19_07880 [Acidimicrobiales bacterium]|nr:hypothetical protein [Acidimicrobiales bacterium]